MKFHEAGHKFNLRKEKRNPGKIIYKNGKEAKEVKQKK